MPSSVIRRFAYRPSQGALDIEFVSGRVYRYLAVPEEIARAMGRVRSLGGYFNAQVRDRFRFLRMPRWEYPEEDEALV